MTHRTWHQHEGFERFYVEESIFGIWNSVSESGESLLSALTKDVCIEMTWLHQYCNAPGYDGRYDLSTHSSSVGVDL